ncbi:response regulator [Rhodocyclus tenuis]|uniref:ATP-binding response regulator n=1 Tax=Rhodocyclus gracilis TaxID=2929842 RepID=UPI001298C796|nr:ATP-binding protein [Rhodocyclus gracilis]MRD74061.1 response regulator [Rhodocyclus gracilis]
MPKPLLIVAREQNALDSLTGALGIGDYQLTREADPEQAWRSITAANADFAAVIIDLTLPDTGGLALLRRIKHLPRLAELPVIMQMPPVDSQELASLLRAGLKTGAYFFISSPCEPSTVLETLNAAMEDAQVKHALARRQRESGGYMRLLREASFVVRTLDEAEQLASFVALAAPQPERALLGLTELLINSIEHGNLGISYEEKRMLKEVDRWRDEVDRRAALPENLDKRVRVRLHRDSNRLLIRVSDDGPGFDWRHYLDFDPRRAFDPNGRGIAMARLASFDGLEYEGDGRVAIATILETGPAGAHAHGQ